MADQATKNLIIGTANRLFREKGYQNVTVMDICKACSISKTTFYYHLKSKEEIILTFYDTSSHQLSQYLMPLLSCNNYWEQLILLFDLLITEAYQYGSDFFSQIIIMNLHENYGSFDFQEELTNIAVTIIKRCQESGQVRNLNPAEDLYKLSGYAFLGYKLTWCMKKGQFDFQKQMREALENIYDVVPELRKR